MRDPEPIIKSSVFDGLAQFLAVEGLQLDVDALMREVEIDPQKAKDPAAYLSMKAVTRFFERAAVLCHRPCIGFQYARAYPIGGAGSIGYLMTEAPTFRDAVSNLVRYIHAFTSPIHIVFEQEDNGVGYLEWVFPLEATASMPQVVSLAVGAVVERLRYVAGPTWTPLQVELIHRELPCPEIYQPMLGSRVRFNAAHNRLWVDQTTLAMRHQQPDDRLYRMAVHAGEKELEVVAAQQPKRQPGIKERVRGHLRGILADGPLELNPVAEALALEPRQLQYLLEQADTSFSEEVSETRRMVAEALLGSSDKSMTEIAAELGFSEVSSFSRACKPWFGMSPSQLRQRIRLEGVAPPRPVVDKAGDDWSERD